MKNITPDDSSIGDKPWSSKHIIDMLCPPLEESGNPVVCYPVAGYALGVKAMWEPAQEGTGTPSPENIRPIKGRDSVTVNRCGENVIEFLSTEDSSSDIKIAVDAEKKYHVKRSTFWKRQYHDWNVSAALGRGKNLHHVYQKGGRQCLSWKR